MKSILIIGAGRSSRSLINYLLDHSDQYNWTVTVADYNLEAAKEKAGNHQRSRAIQLDVKDEARVRSLVEANDVIVSMLPYFMHILVATPCAELGKHMVTASYVSKEIKALDGQFKAANRLFMGELGLDPGIDHMSAMQRIEAIKADRGQLTAFRSFTGGIIAPESDDNPWHYKFTWNPRNVILAGQGTAQYIKDNRYRYVPYARLFKQYDIYKVPEVGSFEGYPNRDSLKYRSAYGLENIPELLRGTFRHVGYCDGWDCLIKLGLTESNFQIIKPNEMTYAQLTEAFMGGFEATGSLEERVSMFLGYPMYHPVMTQLEWLGLFSDTYIPLKVATPADVLEHLLLKKWELKENDRDMVVMHHEFEYLQDNQKFLESSSMVLKGSNKQDTAMARLVGLPLAIFVKHLLLDQFDLTGVHIPIMKQVYDVVLKELATLGVSFTERKNELN